jgi:predicted RNA binding protein YcfA (HicA-like mRNA interferase family)
VNGKEALRRLRGEGWTIIRQTGKHTLLEKGGRMATVSLGDMGRRAERSVLRLLRGQGTRSDQHCSESVAQK